MWAGRRRPARRRRRPGCRRGRRGSSAPGLESSTMRPPAASAAARRCSTCSRATDTSTCIACRSGLAGSSSCIQTVDPWPSGSTALSSASRRSRGPPARSRRRSRRAAPRSASWTSCDRRRSATAPCSRATAETARASSTCRSSSRQMPRVNRTVSRSSASVSSTPDPRSRGPARPPRPAAPPRQRRDAEHRRRPAVQHHPVVDAVRGEERPPSLLAHAHLRSLGCRVFERTAIRAPYSRPMSFAAGVGLYPQPTRMERR